MTKLIPIFLLAILLVSCGATPEEQLKKIQELKPVCEAVWKEVYIDYNWNINCTTKDTTTEVDRCIDKYIDSIDEKYNNPDIVSNLADSNFSEAVKTCNEVFVKK